jgi:hypothetical protein
METSFYLTVNFRYYTEFIDTFLDEKFSVFISLSITITHIELNQICDIFNSVPSQCLSDFIIIYGFWRSKYPICYLSNNSWSFGLFSPMHYSFKLWIHLQWKFIYGNIVLYRLHRLRMHSSEKLAFYFSKCLKNQLLS